MKKGRKEIADLIFNNLLSHQNELKKQFDTHKSDIGFFYLDNLLPADIALEIYKNFPSIEDTVQRKSLKEKKFTAFQMDKYNPLLEEVIYAFQDKRIVALISKICSIETVFPDEFLYAGGLSLMPKDNFLNPHLDNSHDKNRNRWRVLNLLYYVTPDWKLDFGGNLEVWPKGLTEKQVTIASKFNRLAVMATHQKSWHSVSKVTTDKTRCCISNYYFSDVALNASETFHVTTFRGRPQEKIKDIFLQLDNKARSFLRKIFKKGVRENPHQYKK
jgi:Rps23 Pro-64 3,4-dihydroxylase Tpa1-like proline 4-hydroxylase